MIWHPKINQRVKIVYGRGSLAKLPGLRKWHGCTGTVVKVATGPGPINAEVLLDPAEAGWKLIAPRGNLVAIKDQPQ
jgi:hypothetical protein